MQPGKIEIKSLTGIRGIAALYVIIFHWHEVNFISHDRSVPTFINNFINHGYLAVDLFFALSGFVLCISSFKYFEAKVTKVDFISFMTKRFFRIFPLYIIITLLYFILFRQGGLISLAFNLTLLQGVLPPFYGSMIPPGWSLTNEWAVYFIFPFLFYFSVRIKHINIVYPIGSAALLIFICCSRSHLMNFDNYERIKDVEGFHANMNFTRGVSSYIRTIVAYLLGILTFFIYRKNVRIPFMKLLIVPLFALLFVSGSDILVIVSLPVFIYYLTKVNSLNKFLSSKPIHFLGLISYSLYVNHYLFIKTYDHISTLVGSQSNMLSFSYVLIGTLIFSVITYYLIEKAGLTFFNKHRAKINYFIQAFFQPLFWKKKYG